MTWLNEYSWNSRTPDVTVWLQRWTRFNKSSTSVGMCHPYQCLPSYAQTLRSCAVPNQHPIIFGSPIAPLCWLLFFHLLSSIQNLSIVWFFHRPVQAWIVSPFSFAPVYHPLYRICTSCALCTRSKVFLTPHTGGCGTLPIILTQRLRVHWSRLADAQFQGPGGGWILEVGLWKGGWGGRLSTTSFIRWPSSTNNPHYVCSVFKSPIPILNHVITPHPSSAARLSLSPHHKFPNFDEISSKLLPTLYPVSANRLIVFVFIRCSC